MPRQLNAKNIIYFLVASILLICFLLLVLQKFSAKSFSLSKLKSQTSLDDLEKGLNLNLPPRPLKRIENFPANKIKSSLKEKTKNETPDGILKFYNSFLDQEKKDFFLAESQELEILKMIVQSETFFGFKILTENKDEIMNFFKITENVLQFYKKNQKEILEAKNQKTKILDLVLKIQKEKTGFDLPEIMNCFKISQNILNFHDSFANQLFSNTNLKICQDLSIKKSFLDICSKIKKNPAFDSKYSFSENDLFEIAKFYDIKCTEKKIKFNENAEVHNVFNEEFAARNSVDATKFKDLNEKMNYTNAPVYSFGYIKTKNYTQKEEELENEITQLEKKQNWKTNYENYNKEYWQIYNKLSEKKSFQIINSDKLENMRENKGGIFDCFL